MWILVPRFTACVRACVCVSMCVCTSSVQVFEGIFSPLVGRMVAHVILYDAWCVCVCVYMGVGVTECEEQGLKAGDKSRESEFV